MKAGARAVATMVLTAAIATASTAAQAQGEGAPVGATPSSEGQAAVHLRPPVVLRAAPPAYPAGQTTASTVVLAITVGKDGTVRDLSVVQSGGAPFDAAAAAAARRFVFTPAEVNGEPAAVKIPYTLTFAAPPPLVLVHLPVVTSPAAAPVSGAVDAGGLRGHRRSRRASSPRRRHRRDRPRRARKQGRRHPG